MKKSFTLVELMTPSFKISSKFLKKGINPHPLKCNWNSVLFKHDALLKKGINRNGKDSFTLVELMTHSFKTQAFFKRQNLNEFVKKGASCHSKKSFTLVELMTPDYQPKVGVGASRNCKRSFTLVELMIVIAILAILSAIVIFALNPTELFKKSRDSRRLADMNILYKAITFMESWNTNSFSIGTSSVIYLSLPDVSSTCSAYSLPTPPTGYSYNCVTTANLRNTDSTGWVPIDFSINSNNKYFSSLPIDPTNSVNYYYSYNPGGSFEINAFLESTDNINKYALNDGGDSINAIEKGSDLSAMPLIFPHNWIKVPGNSLYGTSDFWVMQYEAKYSVDGHGASDVTADCRNNASYDTYDWGKACTYTANNTNNVVSSPFGSPIAGVTHTEAKAICVALGGHLITNQEWMTIARNADQQPTNWTSGTKGTGYLFNGNSGWSSAGYGTGAQTDKGLNRNIRASHVLSNGSRIYDFAGNVWEHVMFDINDTLLNNQPYTSVNDGVWKGSQFTSLVGYGDNLSADLIKPTDPTWTTSQGVGIMYHYDGGAANPNRVMLRGGSFTNTSNTGVCATNLSSNTGNNHYSFGFRCAR